MHSIHDLKPIDFKARRSQFLSEIGSDVALISAGQEVKRNDDVAHPFRAFSHFYYLTGFEEPGSLAVFSPKHPKHQFILFVPPKDETAELWEGKRAGTEGAVSDYGADIAFPLTELEEKLPEYLSEAEGIYFEMGSDSRVDQNLKQWIERARRMGAPRTGWSLRSIKDPKKILGEMRHRKSQDEIARLKLAAELSGDAHIRAMKECRPGLYEYELEAELLHEWRSRGARREGYQSIVGSGENATVLHYISNQNRIAEGDLVLIDAACEVDYYTADITRTFPASGKFSRQQRELYEVVLAANEEAIRLVKPGVTFQEVHEKAIEVLFEGYRNLGLFSEDLVWAKENWREFYPHNTGHWLGMDVHDVGLYRNEKGEPTRLETGMVFTVEPGVYVRPEGLGKRAEWKPYLGIGIRIEDDIVVTDSGCEVLTSHVPKRVDEIETLMAKARQ